MANKEEAYSVVLYTWEATWCELMPVTWSFSPYVDFRLAFICPWHLTSIPVYSDLQPPVLLIFFWFKMHWILFLFSILVSSKITDSNSRGHTDYILTQKNLQQILQNLGSHFLLISEASVSMKVFSDNILLVLWFLQGLCWREPGTHADTWLNSGILHSHLQGCFPKGL